MTEDYLLGLIPRIRADRVEIYAHPTAPMDGEPLNGPPGSGEVELAALLSPRVRQAFGASRFALAGRDADGHGHR